MRHLDKDEIAQVQRHLEFENIHGTYALILAVGQHSTIMTVCSGCGRHAVTSGLRGARGWECVGCGTLDTTWVQDETLYQNPDILRRYKQDGWH